MTATAAATRDEDQMYAALARADGVTALVTTMDLPAGVVLVTNADDAASELANTRTGEFTFALRVRGDEPVAVATLVVNMPMLTGGLFCRVKLDADEHRMMRSGSTRMVAALLVALADAVDALENNG